MDADRRADREKRIVIVLAAVFAVTFLGSLRRLGMFNRRPASRAGGGSQDTVNVSKPIRVLLQEQWQQTAAVVEELGGTTRGIAPSGATPLYAAAALRDPLKSLLPSAPPAPSPRGQPVVAPPAPSPSPDAPPTLSIQGLVWGGPAPKAIINDAVYAIGERVAGVTILAIDRGGVTIEHLGAAVLYPIPAGARRPQESGFQQTYQRR